MKKSLFKYFIAILFLTIFSGGIAVSIFPNSFKQNRLFSWQKQESENDSSRGENSKETEVKEYKEFFAEDNSFNLSPLHAGLLSQQYRTVDFSFTRTFYLKVPTPPPDRS